VSARPESRAVVVTGVSTGIGLGIARVLVDHGIHVFGSVRRVEDGERTRAELGEGFTPLVFDVTQPGSIQASVPSVASRLRGRTLFGLVNNSGIAIGGPLIYQPLDEVRRVIEVNTIGVLAVTQAFVPLLGADRSRTGNPGRIVNISSVAGRLSAPFLGAYAASKRGLEGMSESLRRELMVFGIDVIVINPGAIATPIWEKAEVQREDRYEKTEYAPLLRRFLERALSTGRSGLPAESVGEVAWEALTTRRPRTFYPIMRNRLTAWTIPLALPSRFLDRLIARRLGLSFRAEPRSGGAEESHSSR
jgi:NAD(P)-dependent dehydrogenase (short-subunit alcohol dehydrogenase family)